LLGDVQDELPLSLGARRRTHRRSGRRVLLMRAAPCAVGLRLSLLRARLDRGQVVI